MLRKTVSGLVLTNLLVGMLAFNIPLINTSSELQLLMETDKHQYQLGENVTIMLTNIGFEVVEIGGYPPWTISTYPDYEPVFPKYFAFLLWGLEPGENHTIVWTQYNEFTDSFVGPGKYVVSDTQQWGLSTYFDIVDIPTISFFPHEVYLDEQTSNFTVSVNIENLQASQRFVGIGLQLEYDSTALSLAGIIEGEFPKDFEKTIFFTIEIDTPIIYIFLDPPYTRFPEGNGTLVALSFMMLSLVEDSTMHLGIRFANDITPPQDDYCHIRRIWNKADLNCDGKVNVVDFVVFAKAFGTYPGQYRWNTNVDLDRNQVTNIRDVVMIAMNFGKTWEYPTSVTGMNDGLELQMTIERVHIDIGDSVNITLTLKNVGNETLMIWFGSSQSFDLYLYYMGVPVARWSDGMVFLAIVRELHLEPGETYTGTPNWKFYLYEPPIPGNYELVGVCVGYLLETSPAVVTSRLPIELS